MGRNYKNHSSGFHNWLQKPHATDWMPFPENLGTHLSIDGLSLSMGEIYTFITNKKGKGKKGTLVACIKGALSQDIVEVLERLPLADGKQVEEVALDMAKNMEAAVKLAFPQATLATDRSHVVKPANEPLQHLRTKERWKELEKEGTAILKAKKEGVKYKPVQLSNGDTPKQLLARSGYIIAKKPNQWTDNQKQRAILLFKLYPHLETAYKHTLGFRDIYGQRDKLNAAGHFDKWIKDTFEKELEAFYTTANTVKANYQNILNFFNNRNTNANAGSFNAKIKLFRANLRGVVDTTFFLFRLHKLFA